MDRDGGAKMCQFKMIRSVQYAVGTLEGTIRRVSGVGCVRR